MPKHRNVVDYVELSLEHKKLVRRLVSPRVKEEDWETFYSTIREIVTGRHGESLLEEASISVDDFMRGELTSFLRENKCERLRQFLNLKSARSDHQHLFGSWFGNVIKSAKAKAVLRSGRDVSINEPVKRKNGRSSDKGGESPGTLIDIIAAGQGLKSKRPKESITLSKLLRRVGGDGFTRLMMKSWAKQPQKTYIAIMDAQLHFHYRKIAALLGKPENLVKGDADEKKEANSIAKKLQRLREELYAQLTLRDLQSMFPFLKKFKDDELRSIFARCIKAQGEAFFGADGEADVDLVEQLGAEHETLYFKSASGGWQLELKLPYAVSDKALIRGVLTDGNAGVPQGVLFCCGAKRKIRANGHFELPVAEFKKFSTSSELHFTPTGGKRSDGIPFVPKEFDEFRPTFDQLASWAARRMSDSSALELTADLLDDFGYVLPQLMLKDEALAALPFEKFGVPRIDRKHLRREYNEAFVLFRVEVAVDPDSPLSPDGFMLPLEWRYNPDAAELPSHLLPLHLSTLGRRVAASLQRDEGGRKGENGDTCKWQLQPAIRFFDDRVDFSSPELLGAGETDAASATAALAVALKYAQEGVRYDGWPFSSIKYDFVEKRPLPVGGVAQKMALASSFGGNELFVSPDQQGIPTNEKTMPVRKVSAMSLRELSDEIAFRHLDRIRPSRPVRFKTVPEDILAPRGNISRDLFTLANRKEHAEEAGTFVVLWGGPGMGKSVLMWLLHKSCTATHKAFGYVCQAGCMNQGWEFVKSLAYGLASTCGEMTDDVLSVPLPDSAPTGNDLRDAYRRLVVEPVRKAIAGRKGERLFILVDGLDEDADGDVARLLLDPQLRFPARVSVVVSSRRIVQDEDRLDAVATDVMDLDEQNTGCARDVRMDIRTYIDQWTCTNEEVYQRLFDSNIDSEVLKDAILEKDRSFLYASYVLGGIADGRYSIQSVEELERDLPKDLKACFYDAFKARFPTDVAFSRVKPLLRLLVRKGRVGEAEAGRRAIVGDETLGAILKALRGYAVEDDGEISLSSEVLRRWLKDATHNAEFGV